MKREKSKEIVEAIVDYAKKAAREDEMNEEAFALGYLKAFAEDLLYHLSEEDYYVKLHLRIIKEK